MKILLLANYNNKTNTKIEEDIAIELENLGHDVERVHEDSIDSDEILEKTEKADMFMFFKGGVGKSITLEDFRDLLYNIECTKVCWYFDKVWNQRVNYIHAIAPLTDFVFLTDGTFIRRHNYFNFYKLKQAVDNIGLKPGKIRKELSFPICFPGTIYGRREQWANAIRQRYGDKFQVVNGIFDQDLNDLVESSKIFVSPAYPQDDFYWSNRIYQIIGRGGFMIFPRLYGLDDEDFVPGKHYETYKDPHELFDKIDYYLENGKEREKIAQAGKSFVRENYTYEDALKYMFKIMENSK